MNELEFQSFDETARWGMKSSLRDRFGFWIERFKFLHRFVFKPIGDDVVSGRIYQNRINGHVVALHEIHFSHFMSNIDSRGLTLAFSDSECVSCGACTCHESETLTKPCNPS